MLFNNIDGAMIFISDNRLCLISIRNTTRRQLNQIISLFVESNKIYSPLTWQFLLFVNSYEEQSERSVLMKAINEWFWGGLKTALMPESNIHKLFIGNIRQ